MGNIATLEQRKWQAAQVLANCLVKNAPKDTWNLALNGIRIMVEDGEYSVIIGGELAPYAVYTNEAWLDEKWNGRKNPNEGWIERSIEECKSLIKSIFMGHYTEQEVKDYIDDYYDSDIKLQYQKAIDNLKNKLDNLKKT